MPKLSIIITAHAEGLLAHKTMRSIFAGLAPFDARKISYEIIIHIDNGTPDTKKYFARYQSHKCCKIYNNHFGDPGLSRNFAINQAKGEFITVTDADDILSTNWLETAYDIVSRSKRPVIVHPSACLTFGIDVKPVLNFYGPSLSKSEDALVLVGENRWGVVVMAPKEVFLRFPYIESKDGYGHEDYYFSTSTVEAGIKHLIAPETVLFYRRGNHSVLDSNNAAGAVQPYSRLFDEVQPALHRCQLSQDVMAHQQTATYKALQHLYHTSLRCLPRKESLKKIAYRFVSRKCSYSPDEQNVIREWRQANRFDSLLCPTREALESLDRYSEFQSVDCGLKYYELVGNFKKKPDYIFILPWLTFGGADKVVINYARAIQELSPDARVMLITTLANENKLKSLLPDNVDFVDFGNATVDLHPFLKDRLLSRIIVQSQCPKVHIINSDYAYNWVKNHLEFAKTLDLRLSAFAYEYVPGFNGECVFDYADMYLPVIAPAVKHIYTDNTRFIQHLVDQCGIDAAKCTTHYQPIPSDLYRPVSGTPHSPLRILWASRVCYAKEPELLCAIARRLNADAFSIDAYGAIEEPYSPRTFSSIPALHYRGAYHGIQDLDTTHYDAFLYTSLNDGMPNVILEMTALGLPIIASDVGGIGEIIQNGKTGTAISGDDPADFVAALAGLKAHYQQHVTMAEAAQALLKRQHSQDAFLRQVKDMLK